MEGSITRAIEQNSHQNFITFISGVVQAHTLKYMGYRSLLLNAMLLSEIPQFYLINIIKQSLHYDIFHILLFTKRNVFFC